jgi:hypothetical protein
MALMLYRGDAFGARPHVPNRAALCRRFAGWPPHEAPARALEQTLSEAQARQDGLGAGSQRLAAPTGRWSYWDRGCPR